MKETINKKNEGSDSAKVASLQNNLAEFGAKLQEVTIEINSLKNYTREQKTLIEADRTLLDTLHKTIAINASVPQASADDVNRTQILITSIRADFTKELRNLSSILTNVNDTLSQRTNENNVELHKHKVSGNIFTCIRIHNLNLNLHF